MPSRNLLLRTFCLVCQTSVVLLVQMRASAQYVGPTPSLRAHSMASEMKGDLAKLLSAPQPPKLIQYDDTVSVQVYGVKEFGFERRVQNDGSITLPLIGKQVIRGLTVEQVQDQIASRLQAGDMVQDAQVIVRIVSQPSLKVTVIGEVEKPGVFAAMGGQTLSDYLALAGGLKATASNTVYLVRPSLPNAVAIPLGDDTASQSYGSIPVFPGDEIRSGKLGVIYVVGAFKTQGAFALKNTSPTTVMDAVALGGGIGFEADGADARIYRTTGEERREIKIDLRRILHGQAEDVALRSDDIVLVPSSKLKAAVKGGGGALAVTLASAYIYAR